MQFTVTSEAWSECIQLRVSVKSDNCGESQDCSAKGVCYSNASMVSLCLTVFYNMCFHIRIVKISKYP